MQRWMPGQASLLRYERRPGGATPTIPVNDSTVALLPPGNDGLLPVSAQSGEHDLEPVASGRLTARHREGARE
jgi:hypothetical protein